MVLLIENQYFGTINYFNEVVSNANVAFEINDTYLKMSFRNRCIIAGANGLITLSVPIEKGRNHQQITKDVKISYHENWINAHTRAIASCYNRAPFFEYYKDSLFDIFRRKHPFLLDLNMDLFNWLLKQYKIVLNTSFTTDYHLVVDDNYSDYRNKFLPKNHQNFAIPGLKYQQVFEERIGFNPNLCILDWLFCAGPSAIKLVKGNENQSISI